MHEITTWNNVFFIASLLNIWFSVPVERLKTLRVGLKITVSTRSTVTSNSQKSCYQSL